jgi:hypothetical protein
LILVNGGSSSKLNQRNFSALSRERSPAASLEEKIIRALKAKGLIRLTPSSQ